MFKTDCPPPDQLQKLLQDELSQQDKAYLSEHVDDCRKCERLLCEMTRTPHDARWRHLQQERVHEQPSVDWLRATARRGRDVVEHATSPSPSSTDGAAAETWLPTVSGYEVLEEIGQGGMGVVYRARHLALHRDVTLKMILRETAPGRRHELLERFGKEAEAIARLRHENIVQIYEVGSCDGRPFMVLEFVKGGHLQSYLQGTPQPPHEVARFIEIVARAIHQAHRQGIVHRDLKPANILLEPEDPEGEGVRPQLSALRPKIADFGLVKLLDSSTELDATATQSILGTPSYMAPEQARSSKEVGPPADIYALGAICYEMLVGRPPFIADTPTTTLLQIVSDEPVPIRRLQQSCPQDLETICLKCLQKEPQRRYASASDLADDLARFLDGEPILARPTPFSERMWLQAKRQPKLAAAIASSLALLMAAVGGLAWGYLASQEQIVESKLRAEAEFRQANAERARAEMEASARHNEANLLGLARVALAEREWTAHDVAEAKRLLELSRPAPGEPDNRGWEWHYVNHLCHSELAVLELDNWGMSVAFSPDGKLLATAEGEPMEWSGDYGGAGKITLWDVATWQRKAVLEESPAATQLLVQFSSTGRWLLAQDSLRNYRVWEVSSGRLCAEGIADSVGFLADDGKLGVVYEAAYYHVELPDAETSVVLRLDSTKGGSPRSIVGPEGRRVVIADASGEFLNVYDAATGELLFVSPTGDNGGGISLAHASNLLVSGREFDDGNGVYQVTDGYAPIWFFSRDDRWLLGIDHAVLTISSGATGEVVQRLFGHSGAVNHAAFSPDSNVVATAGTDHTVRLWCIRDIANLTSDSNTAATPPQESERPPLEIGAPRAVFRGHTSGVLSVAFSPDGARLASAGQGTTVRIWDVSHDPRGKLLPSPPDGGGEWTGPITFTSDGRTIRSLRFTDKVLERDIAAKTIAHRRTLPIGGGVQPALTMSESAFSAGGECVVGPSQADERVAKIWQAETGEELGVLEGHTLPIQCVACSADSDRIATVAYVPEPNNDHYVGRRYFPDTEMADDTGELFVWDRQSRTPVAKLDCPPARCLTLSQDGSLLAAAGFDNVVRVWEIDSGQVVFSAERPGVAVVSLSFSPAGDRLAAGEFRGRILIWNIDGNLEHSLPLPPSENVTCVNFSPDGRRLASIGYAGPVRLWDPATGRRVFTLQALGPARIGEYAYLARVVFSSDGARIASNHWDGSVNVWDAGESYRLRESASSRRSANDD